MTKHITKFIYGLTFLAALAFFAVHLFPAEKIQEYIMINFIRALPDYQVRIGNTTPAFPVGLRLADVKIFRLNEEFIDTAFIKVGLPISSLFSSQKSFSIKAAAYDGKIQGGIRLAKEPNGSGVSGTFDLAGLRIERISPLQRELKEKFAGILGGTVNFDTGNPAKTISFNLNVSDAAMPLMISFIRLGNVTFHDIGIAGSLSNGTLAITEGVFQGPQLDGEISGDIILRSPVEKSTLNLSGRVKPHHELLKNLPRNIIPANLKNEAGAPFTVSGTIEKPLLSFR